MSQTPRTASESSALANLREEVDGVFERFASRWPGFPLFKDWSPFSNIHFPTNLPQSDVSPRVDLAEANGGYRITAELAGLDADDIDVTLSGGSLVIKGEKRDERKVDEEDYHLTERSYGSFRRSFRVPDGVDASKVEATFDKGVLTVSLPKTAQAKSPKKTIAVTASN